MMKWLVYVVFLLVFTPCLSLAKLNNSRRGYTVSLFADIHDIQVQAVGDTIKPNKSRIKTEPRVKEVTKA